jgi:hypothetical protein
MTDPETQATFDMLMERARKLGSGMAELLVTANPPPWDEDWFATAHRNVIDVAGESYRRNYPDYPELLVANMQVRVKEGFENRILQMMDGGLPQRGQA